MIDQEISKVIQSATLLRVDLQSCSCALKAPFVPGDAPNINLVIQRDVKWKRSEDLENLFCAITAIAKGVGGANAFSVSEGQEVFEFSFAFAVFYKLSEKDLTEKALDWFAKNNASYNVHPYWRELTDSLSRRMGIPPVTLPLLKPETFTKP